MSSAETPPTPPAPTADEEKARRAVRVSDIEAQALASQAAAASRMSTGPADMDMSREDMERERQKEMQRQQEALAKFKDTLVNREIESYLKGLADANERESRQAYFARTIVLLLVVLAVVTMPIFAILKGLQPEAFGSYIAPVTGIAGTVVGYWFGTVDRKS